MKKLKHSLLLLLPLVALLSCQEEYKAPQSATVEMAGRWWVQIYADPDQNGIPNPDNLLLDYADYGPHLYTTNTANNDIDSVLVDDSHFWGSRFKAPVSLSGLSFTPATVLNIADNYVGSGETVRIIEGKILKGAARSKSGGVADSIYFEFEFSDSLGDYFIYSGHRDSGQNEDKYE